MYVCMYVCFQGFNGKTRRTLWKQWKTCGLTTGVPCWLTPQHVAQWIPQLTAIKQWLVKLYYVHCTPISMVIKSYGKRSELGTPKIDQNLAQKPMAIHVVGLILRNITFFQNYLQLLVTYVTSEFLFIFKPLPGTGSQIICFALTARGSSYDSQELE